MDCSDDDKDDTCSTSSTAEVFDDDRRGNEPTDLLDLLDPRCLPDLLDPSRLVSVLDSCLGTDYLRGCVVETWDGGLSEHLDAIAHLVLYQASEHVVSQTVYDQLTELSAALRPAGDGHGDRQPCARVDAGRVYGTLRSAAGSLLTAQVDPCCRQSMCRAVGLAVMALQSNTRPVFSVENFLEEINGAANFANLYCTVYAKRICAVLKEIYDTVMAGDYHPTNVVVQMSVMEKSIRAALDTLADHRTTAAQRTAAQRSLLDELDDICATVRMKNHGCLDSASLTSGYADLARRPPSRLMHLTLSPWRAPITMYHQQSTASVDQLFKSTVRLVETLVTEIFKPCLPRRNRRRSKQH
ncbi:uncharacterized protein LOC126834300 isoform X2 [Adelges cooleyi]|nr:uncharacterized protein LOC126834300 isoform X2 [Adelges cooleyi]XP_050422074.1 uncharacterized protein LOC126834300 isoform X2 [Adelges cooleyi]